MVSADATVGAPAGWWMSVLGASTSAPAQDNIPGPADRMSQPVPSPTYLIQINNPPVALRNNGALFIIEQQLVAFIVN
jgi:hypothetical protein